jgi:hypothetical protein
MIMRRTHVNPDFELEWAVTSPMKVKDLMNRFMYG